MVEKYEKNLTNESITSMVEIITSEMNTIRKKDKTLLRVSLIFEEVMLKYQEKFGEYTTCFFTVDKRLNRIRIQLSFSVPSYDPFSDDDSESSGVLTSLLASQGLSPQWSFKDGKNVISYSIQKETVQASAINLVTSIALAVVCGIITKLLPAGIGDFLTYQIFTPMYDTFMGLITFISTPLIFLSVLWGIYSIGDTASLSRIAKQMTISFILGTMVISLVGFVTVMLFYSITLGGTANFAFLDLFEMVLDVVPDNIITPFSTGNTLQIIFIAIVLGLAMLILSDKTTVAAKFCEQTNYMVQLIMETISKLIPGFIFLSFFILVSTNGIELFSEIYIFLFQTVIACVLMTAVYITYACITRNINPIILIKKITPPSLIALTTASSSATFAANVENCEKNLGIDKRLVNIGIPLGLTVYKPGAALMFFSIIFYLSDYYGIEMNIGWCVTLFLVTVILSIAAPPIPGGGLTVYALIVAQAGLPSEAVAQCCALNFLPEFLVTTVDIALIQVVVIVLAARLNMLNYEKLREK